MVVKDLFNTFYADLQVVPKSGKTFVMNPDTLNLLKSMDGVEEVAQIVEENALVLYDEKQIAATVKGVSENYVKVTGIDTMMWDGEYKQWEGTTPYAVIGRGIKYMLNIDLKFFESLRLIVPKRTAKISLDPNRALNSKLIQPAGFFVSQPEIEIKYILVPIDFARSLFDYTHEITSLEIKTRPNSNLKRIQKNIQQFLGKKLLVKNRVQQNELLYKTMRSEKWAIFFILVFILLVASFNVVGTLSMLIIEKKNDIQTLRNLGSNIRNIKKVFLLEGLIISFLGALAGLLIGTVICLIQQHFGIIKLRGSESFVIDSYPIKIMVKDIFLVLFTITSIGFFASWYPIRYITRKYLSLVN